MKLNHRKVSEFPTVVTIEDEAVKLTFLSLFKQLHSTFKNIYDDLTNNGVGSIGTLPTASIDYLGKHYLKSNSGADDTLHICIYDGAASGYKWQEIALV